MEPKLSFVVVCLVLLGTSTVIGTNTTILLNSTVILPSPTVSVNQSSANASSYLNSMSAHGINISSTVIPHGNTSTNVSTISSLYPSPTASHNYSVTTILSSMLQNASSYSASLNQSMSSMVQNVTSSAVVPSSAIHPNATTSVVPTTTVMPTTMPPTPQPPHPEGDFGVKKNNKTCLLLWLSLEITITYVNSTGSELKAVVQMPTNESCYWNGTCDEAQGSSSIKIFWPKENPFYSAKIMFQTRKEFGGGASHWITKNITLTALTDNTDFKNASVSQIQGTVTDQRQLEFMSGSIGHSLICQVEKNVTLGKDIVAEISNLRLQPFELDHEHFSNNVDSCEPGPTTKPTPAKKGNNTVAIAVGCSLAGLVVIVVIGYLIGRRRGKSTGYRKL